MHCPTLHGGIVSCYALDCKPGLGFTLTYKSAIKNNTDITKGMFYFYNPTLTPGNQNKLYVNPSGIDLRLAPSVGFHVTDFPQIIGFHSSIWSSIYRADFIKKIKIPETAGASYQDFPFMIDAMCRAKRISVVKKPFVHWRNEPKQGNSTSARGKKLLLMAQNTENGLKIIKNSGFYDELKEPFYAHALWTNIGFFYRIERRYKKEYYQRLRRIFAELKHDETFTYKYFRPEDKMAIRAILKYKGWDSFYVCHILGGIRRRISRLGNIISVYHKVAVLEEKVNELELEKNILYDQLNELENL